MFQMSSQGSLSSDKQQTYLRSRLTIPNQRLAIEVEDKLVFSVKAASADRRLLKFSQLCVVA